MERGVRLSEGEVRERVGGERAALLRLWQRSVVAGAVDRGRFGGRESSD